MPIGIRNDGRLRIISVIINSRCIIPSILEKFGRFNLLARVASSRPRMAVKVLMAP